MWWLAGISVANMLVARMGFMGGGVDQRYNPVEAQFSVNLRVKRDAGRVSHAACLYHNMVGARASVEGISQCDAQIIADRTAHAAIRQRYLAAMLGRDKFAVDIQRAEIIDQRRDAPPVGMVQQMIEQAGFAGAQKTGDDCKRGGGCAHLLLFIQVFSGALLRWTAPPTTVPVTPIFFNSIGATSYGSSSNMAKSARLPTSMLPIS